MMTSFLKNFYYRWMYALWVDGREVEVGQWQSQDIRDRPEMVSRELTHMTLKMDIPASEAGLIYEVQPNMPWAEDHFRERISGQPLNPPPSEEWWPFRVRGNQDHKEVEGSKFSHTYPERFWPRFANAGETRPNGRQVFVPHNGIRYEYGDLDDVVQMLRNNPLTRQAYLPIWFPEDTGAIEGQRVPCTLGYHFIIRNNRLDIVYYMRSCDLLRHFKDDVYMACRLAQHVVDKLRPHHRGLGVGHLVMHISSLHFFRGDYPMVRGELLKHGYDPDQEETYGSPV